MTVLNGEVVWLALRRAALVAPTLGYVGSEERSGGWSLSCHGFDGGGFLVVTWRPRAGGGDPLLGVARKPRYFGWQGWGSVQKLGASASVTVMLDVAFPLGASLWVSSPYQGSR